jgi:DNA-binding XRE family transcriptional regulator
MPTPSRTPQHRALGRAVRELRACHGVSQEELGFRSGLHRNYVGAIERGELNPTLGVLLRLAAGLGVPLSELIGLGERRAAGDLRHPAPVRTAVCGAASGAAVCGAASGHAAPVRAEACGAGAGAHTACGTRVRPGAVRLLPLWDGRRPTQRGRGPLATPLHGPPGAPSLHRAVAPDALRSAAAPRSRRAA